MEGKIIQHLADLIKGELRVNEPMKRHTSFKIGGPAEVFILPANSQDVQQIILYSLEHKIPWYVIGNGSNLLIKDQGICGIVIKISGVIADIFIKGEQIHAGVGAFLPLLANEAAKYSLSGLEHTISIPGSLGGAIVQNAGSCGKQIGDLIKGVEVLTGEGEIKTLKQESLDFGYRSSCFKQPGQIILQAELELIRGKRGDIEAEMKDILKQRRERFPLNYPNAGSIFKNPAGEYAASLIEQAGCKGMSCGGAQVSTRHANFIINRAQATCQDVLELMSMVQDKVFSNFNLKLEPEIVIL